MEIVKKLENVRLLEKCPASATLYRDYRVKNDVRTLNKRLFRMGALKNVDMVKSEKMFKNFLSQVF